MKIRYKALPLLLIISILFTSLPSNTLAAALKIIAINDLNASVYVNQSYSLPKNIDAKMSNKTTQKVMVAWNPNTVLTSKAGLLYIKVLSKAMPRRFH